MFRAMGVTAAAWIGLNGWATSAWAAHPFGAEDAHTVGAGVAEVELATALDAHRGTVAAVGVSVVLHVGLLDGLDLGTELSLASSAGGVGAWRTEMVAPLVDAKWRLREPDGAIPGVAAKVVWEPPLSTDGAAAGHGLAGTVAATWVAGPVEVAANVGVAGRAGASSAPRSYFVTAVGASLAVSELVHVGVDTLLSLAAGESIGLDVMAGALFHVAPGRIVSVGVGAGWHDAAAPMLVATAGVTATFGGAAP